ncbi:bridging integrator 3-like [Tubulanus polymorphus]|uniref:bridging integrator 3-like n=1 Tax=Tubulanus polymorphus TaxID=672921 RepID=UPI003DA5EA76
MSWNPFKRNDAPRRSVISKSAEREFERDVKKLEELDECGKKLNKDTKRCIENSGTLVKTELKLSQDLTQSSLYQTDEQFKMLTDDWAHAITRLDLLTQEKNAVHTKTMVEPLKKFSSIFPGMRAAVKKRESSLQEYTRCQEKVDRYRERERTGPNIVKLEQSKKALTVAKEDFETQNQILREDLPRLYEGRIDFFEPCFQALIKTQVTYFTEAHKIYSELSGKMTSEKDLLLDDSYENQLDNKLSEIRSLSIIADD